MPRRPGRVPWQGSDRRSRLPSNWPQLEAEARRRNPRQVCHWCGPDGVTTLDHKIPSDDTLEDLDWHRDLRTDQAGTAKAIANQPKVAEARKGCAECAALMAARAEAPRQLGKVRLTLQEVGELVGLPPNCRPRRMYVIDDPHDLCVVFESDALEPIPSAAEAPPIRR